MLTKRDVITKANTLAELSTRTLPTLGSDLKVAGLRRHYETPALVISADREVVIKRFQKDVDGKKVLTDPAALQDALNAFLDAPAEVALPKARIDEADLPATLAGEDGAKNRAGLADLILGLGFLYSGSLGDEA